MRGVVPLDKNLPALNLDWLFYLGQSIWVEVIVSRHHIGEEVTSLFPQKTEGIDSPSVSIGCIGSARFQGRDRSGSHPLTLVAGISTVQML